MPDDPIDDLVLRTPRLVLRPVREEDASVLLELHQDPDVVRFMGGQPTSLSEEEEGIRWHRAERFGRRGFGIFAVLLQGEIIGRAGFRLAQLDGREEVELTYLLFPRFRGQGYATEAVGALLQWIDASGDAPRIVGIVHPENGASIHILESAGFHRAGTTDHGPLKQAFLYLRNGAAGAGAARAGSQAKDSQGEEPQRHAG